MGDVPGCDGTGEPALSESVSDPPAGAPAPLCSDAVNEPAAPGSCGCCAGYDLHVSGPRPANPVITRRRDRRGPRAGEGSHPARLGCHRRRLARDLNGRRPRELGGRGPASQIRPAIQSIGYDGYASHGAPRTCRGIARCTSMSHGARGAAGSSGPGGPLRLGHGLPVPVEDEGGHGAMGKNKSTPQASPGLAREVRGSA
jgi:hypothetical protein